MSSLLEKHDIEHVLVSPRYPQSDPFECLKRTLKSMIRAYVAPDHRTWDSELMEKVFNFITSVHKTTGYTPFYLCSGKNPSLSPTPKRPKEHKAAKSWDEDTQHVRQIVKDNQKESTERQAKN